MKQIRHAMLADASSIATSGRLAPLLNSKEVPELTLMRSPHIAWVAPLLSKLREPMKVEDFHALTAATLVELRRDYPDMIPVAIPEEAPEEDQEGRARALSWLQKSWIRRVNSNDGSNDEMYALTTAAIEVLTMLSRISDPRTAASRTQFEAIRDLVRSLASVASDDPVDRMQRLVDQRDAVEAQIAELQHRIDEGAPMEIDGQSVREHVVTLFTLTDTLPVSFRMVEQAVTEAHREMIDAINSSGEREPRGEMLASTLSGVNGLLDTTEAGRTFKSLDDWLSSTAAHQALADSIEAFLTSSGAAAVPAADRNRVRELPQTLRTYIRGVQTYYANLTSGLDQYLRMTSNERTALHMALSELDHAARHAIAEGFYEDIELNLGGGPIEIESITRYSLPRPLDHTDPELDEAADEWTAYEVASYTPFRRRIPLAQLIELLNAHINTALEKIGNVSGSELFEALDVDQRSVLTLVDMLRVAIEHCDNDDPVTSIDGNDRQTVAVYEADGTVRAAHIPRMNFMRAIPIRSLA